ncbi:MAG: tripartite tricarboxylate transporter substrate binding protein [Alphaproteobacteria bacterium]|nr:tripartite tricarboxylate transporter substrate binding protein [Alphaproteobacteria bacterium]
MIRRTLLAAGAAALALASQGAWAQAFPSRPIKIIVPFGAGTGTDVLARVIGERISETLGQPVVAENREGAGGLLGAQVTQKSPADGYTLMMAANPFVVAPQLQAVAPYDVTRDFTAVAKIGVIPMALVTASTSPYRTIAELVDFAKANPGKLNYASSGMGSPSHLEMELIKQEFGLRIQDVPYKSTSQAMMDTLGGQVGLYFPTLPVVTAQMKSGQLRLLATGGARRAAQAPDVPTLAEAFGKPGWEATVWYGFVGPAGMPKDVVAKLSEAIITATEHPAAKQRIENSGTAIEAGGPEVFAALLKRETEKWGPLVRSLGLKATN